MKRLFGIFKKRWFLSLLGLVALAALIWFLGPLFAFAGREPLADPIHRVLLISAIFLLWLIRVLWKWLAAKRANLELLRQMAHAAPASESAVEKESAEEVAGLRRRFEEALAVLKKARLEGRQGRQFLYQLPWYIIIGAPGSGKTTALCNSGLQFPLADRFGKDKVGGVGGTRNCDWFFTDEAVLLDTAGRYTTQDSHQAIDKVAWHGFLGLLKRYRRRRPINGALIAVSVGDLLQHSEAQRGSQARAIRMRIQELHEQLGIRFPIYVLFTKCDLLAGFIEFFDDLGKEERAQVWGMSFPLVNPQETGKVLAQFGPEIKALQERLHERLLERLQSERDQQKRALIYGFPQQFGALQEVVEWFLTEVFQPTKFEESMWLRGVYFTSGTQEGTPIDRIMSSLAANFGLDRQVLGSPIGSGRSYFITRLLRDVIFLEAGLAGTNLKLERQRAWLQRGAYACALGITVLAASAWLVSYTKNQQYIQRITEQVQAIRQEVDRLPNDRGGVLATLPLLNAVRDLPGGYRDRNAGTPWLMGFGLYQGDKLGTGAQDAYRRLLREVFLRRILERLEDQLRHSNAESLYEGLKVYLMLHEPQHFKAEVVKNWITQDWERAQSQEITLEQRQQLISHLEALLERGPIAVPIAPDTGLIQQARETLSRVPLEQRVYQRLKSEYSTDKTLPELRFSEAAGRDAALVFVRRSGAPLNKGIPGLYTYAGYHEVFEKVSDTLAKQLADEAWIYGDQPIVADVSTHQQLREKVCQLYLDDYEKQWDQLIGDVSVITFHSLPQAVRGLNVLSGTGSPLRKWLMAVEHETILERPTAEVGAVDKGGSAPIIQAKQRLKEAISGQPTTPACKKSQLMAVEDHFEPINRQVQTVGDNPPPIDGILALLNELYVYLDPIANAPNPAEAAKLASAGGELTKAMGKVKMEATRLPVPIGGLLEKVSNNSSNLAMGNARAHLDSVWTSAVVPFFRAGLSGRYPLVRYSSQDITHEDFARFFGPGGLLDEFFQTQLAPHVDTSGSRWRWRSQGSAVLGISPGVLLEFQRATIIKDAFFRGGGQTISMRFELKPLFMDADINQFLLDLDGQIVTYSHGPVRPFPLQWPGPNSTRQVRIQISPAPTSGRSGLTEEGPWAWLRMLDKAHIEPTAQRERFRLTFDIEGHKIAFELWASSVFNPFRLQALEQFRCPDRL
jgi:type VI secretion system protein ImpL